MTVNLPLLAAAATGVQVGAAIVAPRLVVAEVPPLTLALLRYAIGLLCLLPFVLKSFRALPVSAFAMLASVLLLALLALPENWPARVAALGAASWAVVVFISLSSGVGYFLWLYALKHEAPTRVTVFLALNPVTAAMLGTLFLHETIDGWSLHAIFLIASGLWLATRSRPAQPR